MARVRCKIMFPLVRQIILVCSHVHLSTAEVSRADDAFFIYWSFHNYAS